MNTILANPTQGTVTIGTGPTQETRKFRTLSHYSLVLDQGLRFDHARGEAVVLAWG